MTEQSTKEKEEPFIEDEGYVCALANLNLRKAPNLSSEVLEVIPKFSKLRKRRPMVRLITYHIMVLMVMFHIDT